MIVGHGTLINQKLEGIEHKLSEITKENLDNQQRRVENIEVMDKRHIVPPASHETGCEAGFA